ncbi:hypothetical protein RISK_000007 [Rhodopirellula islandica]|uniref:Uncharacterized protein n=1 Tax=Rhodopirellula islandica TaxID=595434 RepID=A0A0J1BMZ4_RHOIS|nr:hypothetical protein RISK_000007 [Rhodopirellula islandica]
MGRLIVCFPAFPSLRQFNPSPFDLEWDGLAASEWRTIVFQ